MINIQTLFATRRNVFTFFKYVSKKTSAKNRTIAIAINFDWWLIAADISRDAAERAHRAVPEAFRSAPAAFDPAALSVHLFGCVLLLLGTIRYPAVAEHISPKRFCQFPFGFPFLFRRALLRQVHGLLFSR